MNKTHVKRTLRILLACFLMLVFVAMLVVFILYLKYQIKYNWLDSVYAIAHELYSRNYRPEHSLIGFPLWLFVFPFIEAILAFLIIRFGFNRRAIWAFIAAVLILVALYVVVILCVKEYYNGFGERLDSLIRIYHHEWYYDDHSVEIVVQEKFI